MSKREKQIARILIARNLSSKSEARVLAKANSDKIKSLWNSFQPHEIAQEIVIFR